MFILCFHLHISDREPYCAVKLSFIEQFTRSQVLKGDFISNLAKFLPCSKMFGCRTEHKIFGWNLNFVHQKNKNHNNYKTTI